MKIIAKTLFLSLALGALTTSALAQGAESPKGRQPDSRPDGPRGKRDGDRPAGRPEGRPGMGQPLSPEKMQAAWELEAKGVAGRLKLSPEQTSALVRGYVEARTTMRNTQEEVRKARQSGDMQDPMQAIREGEEAAKAQLTKAMTDAKITGENATKINESLGTAGLNGASWDRMVDAVAGFKLEAEKQQTALNAIESFVVERSAVTRSIREGGDRQEIQTKFESAREKLLTTMRGVLSGEQMQAFEATTGGRGGGEMRRARPQDGDQPGNRPEGRPGRGEPKKK